jgi:hypothetical protein
VPLTAQTGFYNQDKKCLQRGTDWIFKQSGLRLFFKELAQSHTIFRTVYNLIQSQHFTLRYNFRIIRYNVVTIVSDSGMSGWDSILGTGMGFLFYVSCPRRQRVLKFAYCGLRQEKMKGTTHLRPVSMLGIRGALYTLLV